MQIKMRHCGASPSYFTKWEMQIHLGGAFWLESFAMGALLLGATALLISMALSNALFLYPQAGLRFRMQIGPYPMIRI